MYYLAFYLQAYLSLLLSRRLPFPPHIVEHSEIVGWRR